MKKVEIFIEGEWKFTAGLIEKDLDILFRVAEALSDTAEA